jgi:DNA-binding PadR family transcriptional regulator
MNSLEKAILKTLLIKQKLSIYELNDTLKSNYATVWRYVKKMLEDKLLTVSQIKRKDGKPDKRNTQILSITNKGVATFLIRGNPTREELLKIGSKSWQPLLENLSMEERFLTEAFFADSFADSLIEIKPKVNLEFFDEKWFFEVWSQANVKALKKAEEKYRPEFEKKGIWVTEKELRENTFNKWLHIADWVKNSKLEISRVK